MNTENINKILIYARPWNKDQFKDIANYISKDSDKLIVSEHKSVDECGLNSLFYGLLASNRGAADKNSELNEEEVKDVIERCRLLRAIDEQKARVLVFAMETSIAYVLDDKKPGLVLSVTIDSYIIHLIYICCQRRGIPFVGLIPSFVNGYFRITALGERNASRNVESEEIKKIANILTANNYKPSFLGRNDVKVRNKAIKRWVRNILKPLWFCIKRIISRDVFNYHFFATQIVSSHYWSIYPVLYSGLRPGSRLDLADPTSNKKLIFLPLQMSPEATIDYWTQDKSWIDYEKKIINLLDDYADSAIFAIKEHPNVLGNRTRGFYKKLASHKACRLIDADCNSNLLIAICDGVLICTGTVGFEAALRGKPVYSDTVPFHLPASELLPLEFIKGSALKHQPDGMETKFCSNDLLKYLLEGLLPGSFINDGSWSSDNIEHKESNKIIGRGISSYINKYIGN